MIYLQVSALNELIIRNYLHEFTNNEREISIPHEAAKDYVIIMLSYQIRLGNFTDLHNAGAGSGNFSPKRRQQIYRFKLT